MSDTVSIDSIQVTETRAQDTKLGALDASALETSSAPKTSYFTANKIRFLILFMIAFFIVNTEAFILHVMRHVPGAVRPGESVLSGIGIIVQGVILMLLYVAIDMLVSNEAVI